MADVEELVKLPVEGVIVKWKVTSGQAVKKGTDLCEYRYTIKVKNQNQEDFTKTATLQAQMNFRSAKILVNEGIVVKPNQPILSALVTCEHPMRLGNLCAVCGSELPADLKSQKDDFISVPNSSTLLKMSKNEAERYDSDANMLRTQNRKLVLVCDLDQTLVHASIDQGIGELLEAKDPRVNDVHRLDIPGNLPHYIRLRPYLREFFKNLTPFYEFHIYTFGSRSYAAQVASVLDIEKTLFQDRIISRDECPKVNFKTLETIFPVDSSMAVVIDDRADVWQWSPNLIKVNPYEFFEGAGDINAIELQQEREKEKQAKLKEAIESGQGEIVPTKPFDESDDSGDILTKVGNESLDADKPISLTKKDLVPQDQPVQGDPPRKEEKPQVQRKIRVKEKDLDDELPALEKVLIDLHHRFYNLIDLGIKQSVEQVITSKRREVLFGVVILFSGVIPLEIQPQKSDLWRLSETFGAKCVDSFEGKNNVTHVVAARKTEKVVKGLADPAVCVVTLDWLRVSIKNWVRQDESKYQIQGIEYENIARRNAAEMKHSISLLDEPEDVTPGAGVRLFLDAEELADLDEDSDSSMDQDEPAPVSRKRKFLEVETESTDNPSGFGNHEKESEEEEEDDGRDRIRALLQKGKARTMKKEAIYAKQSGEDEDEDEDEDDEYGDEDGDSPDDFEKEYWRYSEQGRPRKEARKDGENGEEEEEEEDDEKEQIPRIPRPKAGKTAGGEQIEALLGAADDEDNDEDDVKWLKELSGEP